MMCNQVIEYELQADDQGNPFNIPAYKILQCSTTGDDFHQICVRTDVDPQAVQVWERGHAGTGSRNVDRDSRPSK